MKRVVDLLPLLLLGSALAAPACGETSDLGGTPATSSAVAASTDGGGEPAPADDAAVATPVDAGREPELDASPPGDLADTGLILDASAPD